MVYGRKRSDKMFKLDDDVIFYTYLINHIIRDKYITYIYLIMGKIILKCVTEKRKLRIKFHCYINAEGKEYRNVYNNKYN